MNKKIICILVSALILGGIYFSFMNYRNNTDRLFARFNNQLREEKFEEIYDESDDVLQRNITKEKFVQRMKDAVGKLKQIDNNLNFQKDFEMEKAISPEGFSTDYSLRTIQRLDNGNDSVRMLIYWENKGISPKFSDLAVQPISEGSEKYSTIGVNYNKINK